MPNSSSPLILLCGGKSSRMGQPKGLLGSRGKAWLEQQLIQFATYGNEAVVVLGHDSDLYLRALPFLCKAETESLSWNGIQLSVKINANPELGPFSSLRAGLTRLREATGAFILPIDVPAPATEIWRQLQRAGEARSIAAVIPQFQGLHGHPVWLAHSFLLGLRKVPLDSALARLDHQIHTLPPGQREYVAVSDRRVVMNMNTPEQFEQLNQMGDLP